MKQSLNKLGDKVQTKDGDLILDSHKLPIILIELRLGKMEKKLLQ